MPVDLAAFGCDRPGHAIGSIARYHYALMGALWEPPEIEATARAIAGFLKQDQVDAALLVPV